MWNCLREESELRDKSRRLSGGSTLRPSGLPANRSPIFAAARSSAVRTFKSGSGRLEQRRLVERAGLGEQIAFEEFLDRRGDLSLLLGPVSLFPGRGFGRGGSNRQHDADGGSGDKAEQDGRGKPGHTRISPAPAEESPGRADRAGQNRTMPQKSLEIIRQRSAPDSASAALFPGT